MLDTPLRTVLERPFDTAARVLDRSWITPDRLTVAGLIVGLGAATAAGLAWWWLAVALWLASRVADGLDGPLARRRVRLGTAQPGSAGGFLDIMADFTVYGAFVLGVGIGVDGPMLPFAAVLLAYYLNGAAFLAFSSIAERTGHQLDDGRSLSFLGGLAEGTETIVVHTLWALFPAAAPVIAWVWAVVVGVSAGQRIVTGYRTLRRPA